MDKLWYIYTPVSLYSSDTALSRTLQFNLQNHNAVGKNQSQKDTCHVTAFIRNVKTIRTIPHCL